MSRANFACAAVRSATVYSAKDSLATSAYCPTVTVTVVTALLGAGDEFILTL